MKIYQVWLTDYYHHNLLGTYSTIECAAKRKIEAENKMREYIELQYGAEFIRPEFHISELNVDEDIINDWEKPR